MKRLLLTLISFFLIINIYTQGSIYDLIYFGNCRELKLEGETMLYVGDDLFNLINGGAELYHELGFVEVLALKVAVGDQGTAKVEIYDMGSSEAAWGIFSMTATSDARYLELGDTARSGQGFIQMIKDRYMVYSYPEKMEVKGAEKILSCIASNIGLSSKLPALLAKMNSLPWDANKSIYFTGNLGLSSVYNFHYKDVFEYEEGAAIISNELICVVLKYNTADQCDQIFNTSYQFFKEKKKYHNPRLNESSYHLNDRKEMQLDFHKQNNYLIIFIHEGSTDVDGKLSEVKALFNV